MAFKLDHTLCMDSSFIGSESRPNPARLHGRADLLAHVGELHAMHIQGILTRSEFERSTTRAFLDYLCANSHADFRSILNDLEALWHQGHITRNKFIQYSRHLAAQRKGIARGSVHDKAGWSNDSSDSLYGVQGLLLAVCLVLGLICPLTGLVHIYLDWSTLELFTFNPKLHQTLSTYYHTDMAVTGLFIVLFLAVGFLLWKENPHGLRLAKAALLGRIAYGLWAMSHLRGLDIGGFHQTSIFRIEFVSLSISIAILGVVFFYLQRSRRVKLTYALA